jgi:hypothetical protein
MKWYEQFCQTQKDQVADERGFKELILDGVTSAYLLLAYDLYILRHHGKLEKEVLRRLRIPALFIGARYELFVAATFIRAGFDIAYEDESDSSKKHPEFVATHRESRLVVSVEAKARHRDSGVAVPTNPRVKHLLKAAAEKKGAHPLIAMIEVSMPPEDAARLPSWVPAVEKDLAEVVAEYCGKSPLSMVGFSNIPHRYGEPGEADPARHFYAMWPEGSAIPERIIDMIGDAVHQYGNVPDTFPGDFDFEL